MSPSPLIAVVAAASITCAFASPASAQRTTYGVTAEVENAPALLKAATYVFAPGQPSYDKAVDKAVISAIDREMTARGVTKVASGRSDIVVTYLSVRRTDVDLKSKPSAKDGTLREYAVGTLVVSVSDPADRQKKFFTGRIDKPLDLDPATFEATINAAVAAIFEKYPKKGKTP